MESTGMGAEILLIFALLIANGAFALSEMAIVSARRTRLLQRAEEGDAGARRALELANHPNRFLSTVQIGITLIGILAGAYGGATIAEQLGDMLQRFSLVAPYHEGIAFGIVVAAITFLSLVIGELVPKRIALTHPERIASLIAGPMHVVSVAATPLVKVLGASTDFILRILRVQKSTDASVTEEEITTLIEEGARIGVLAEQERELLQRTLALGDRRVDQVMTPRRRMVYLDLLDPPERSADRMREHRHSRYPVCEGGIDRVLGVVDVRELWARHLAGQQIDLRAHLVKPLFVPETMTALRLLQQFRESGIHIALVVDEYGGIHGLVTLNDVLEEITGDLVAREVARFRQRDDGSWLVDASVSMDEFWDAFELDEQRVEDRQDYTTLGGFVFSRLGHVPVEGEWFVAFGLRFEIIDMDGYRVDKLLVTPSAAAE